jgi:hypothetical protein
VIGSSVTGGFTGGTTGITTGAPTPAEGTKAVKVEVAEVLFPTLLVAITVAV